MIETEKHLPEDIKMIFVSIVTPNHVHFHPAKLALENGFHVVLDKPMTYSLQEAIELKNIALATKKIFLCNKIRDIITENGDSNDAENKRFFSNNMK